MLLKISARAQPLLAPIALLVTSPLRLALPVALLAVRDTGALLNQLNALPALTVSKALMVTLFATPSITLALNAVRVALLSLVTLTAPCVVLVNRV
jgi:hypothetical protein